jgi:hypothetical protein
MRINIFKKRREKRREGEGWKIHQNLKRFDLVPKTRTTRKKKTTKTIANTFYIDLLFFCFCFVNQKKTVCNNN